jgi:ferric-dicitrate binding protein FerR (iron transport regulator)
VSSERSRDERLDATAERVADFLSAHVDVSTSANSREQKFVRRLATFRQIRRKRRRLAAGLTVAVTLVIGGTAGWRFRRDAPASALSYQVDDKDPPAGGYILVPETADARLAFSDGSNIRMAARTRGRVVEVDNRGATIALDSGDASVDIVPRPRARWTFEAGPFRINVHGTSFNFTWNPADAVFEVRLSRGAISVASPLAGPDIEMRAGQTLRASLRDQTISMGTTSSPLAQANDKAVVAAGPPEPPRETPVPQIAAPSRWSHRGWMTMLAEDRAAGILADADRRGPTAVLERADSDDLWALANAARYVGRYPLAEQALSAHRKRFPSSVRSRQAAFLLGRLHEDDSGGPVDALGWYDRYLAEARGGAGVSDALGRKMTLLQRSHRHTEALVVARDYLRRFPHGTYAQAARALVRSSTPSGE